MKNLTYSIIFLITLIIISCGEDDTSEEKSKNFSFLTFEKKFYQKSEDLKEIKLIGFDFDQNKKNWQISIFNGDKEVSSKIKSISGGNTGYVIGNKTRYVNIMVLSFENLEIGDYSITLKNLVTNQSHTDQFYVKEKTFNKMIRFASNGKIDGRVTSSDGSTPTQLYQNTGHYVENEIDVDNIYGATLIDTKTSNKIEIGTSVIDKKLNFTLPKEVATGRYLLVLKGRDLIDVHFESEIYINEEKLPVITSINKEIYDASVDQEIIIKGNNFRYTSNKEGKDRSFTLSTYVIISGQNNIIDNYEGSTTAKQINSEGTEIRLNMKKVTRYPRTDEDGNKYMSGEIIIANFPYYSNPIKFKIINIK